MPQGVDIAVPVVHIQCMPHINYESGRAKNACAADVLQSFGCWNFKYAQFERDVLGVLRRNGWGVRSRATAFGLKKGLSVSKLSRLIREGAREEGVKGYFVVTPGHAMALNVDGTVRSDTECGHEGELPKNDRRKVRAVYCVRY